MCIAIASMNGNPAPSKEYLKNCWTNNPDGAGFCFANNGMVQIRKGFMTWDSFWNTYEKYNKKYDFDKNAILIHFRIATHGGINKECCHPFPVVGDGGMMQKLETASEYAAIHNGIISLTGDTARKKEKMSDTMVFIEDYLSKIATNPGWFENPSNMELIHDLIESKMAIMNNKGAIKLTEGFIRGTDGNYYSNSTYSYSGYYGYGYGYGYGWDDEWDDYYSREYCYCQNDSYYHKTKEVPMLKVKPGEMIIFDDGGVEYYDDLDEIDAFYVTKEGDVYWGVYSSLNEAKTELIYMGEGEVMSTEGAFVDFRKDVYVDSKHLDEADADAFINETDTDTFINEDNIKEEGLVDEDGKFVNKVKYEEDYAIIYKQHHKELTMDAIKRCGFTDLTPETGGLTFKKFTKYNKIYKFSDWGSDDTIVLKEMKTKNEAKLTKEGDYHVYIGDDDLSLREVLEECGFKNLTPMNSPSNTLWEKEGKFYSWCYDESTEFYEVMKEVERVNSSIVEK